MDFFLFFLISTAYQTMHCQSKLKIWYVLFWSYYGPGRLDLIGPLRNGIRTLYPGWVVDTRNQRVKMENNMNQHLWIFKFIFRKTNRLNQYKLNLKVLDLNQVTIGTKSSRYLGPNIWNPHSLKAKSMENFPIFKRIMKTGI